MIEAVARDVSQRGVGVGGVLDMPKIAVSRLD